MCITYSELSVDFDALQFEQLLGRGTFGTVHKGKWKEKTVALKRIPIPAGMDTREVLANNREIAALRLAN